MTAGAFAFLVNAVLFVYLLLFSSLKAAIGVFILSCVVWKILFSSRNGSDRRVLVICLGDIGRSPRMTYHCLSLAVNHQVDYLSYRGAKPHSLLIQNPNVHLHQMSPLSWRLQRAFFLVYAPIKICYQLYQLFSITLFEIPRPEYILIQNPPAIPTLFVAHVVAVLRSSKLIIDWHNFGYTILGLSLGQSHLLVKISYWYEKVLGRGAWGNLCVSEAMRAHLQTKWQIPASVL